MCWGDQRDKILERMRAIFTNPPLEVRQLLEAVRSYQRWRRAKA